MRGGFDRALSGRSPARCRRRDLVGANGGYRSPAHQRNEPKSPHCWATAADIYRIGGTYLDDEKSISKYGDMAQSLGPQVFARPYTQGDDHLHIDLGFITVTPRNCSEP